MQRENSNTQTPKLITPLPALLPLQKREMPSQAGLFGARWLLDAPPPPPPAPFSFLSWEWGLGPHASPGNNQNNFLLGRKEMEFQMKNEQEGL